MQPNDVELIRIWPRQGGATEDYTLDISQPFDLVLEAQVGDALFGNGGNWRFHVIVRDFSDAGDGSDVIYTQNLNGNFNDTNWDDLKETFVLSVPAAAIAGRDFHILEAMAVLEVGGNGASAPDVSFSRSRLFTARAA